MRTDYDDYIEFELDEIESRGNDEDEALTAEEELYEDLLMEQEAKRRGHLKLKTNRRLHHE